MISIVSISGLLLALFLPGFCITLLFFREANFLERVMLSITFSIMIAIAIGIALGYNKEVKNMTGGITPANVWKWELAITSALLGLVLIINWRSISFKNMQALLKKTQIKGRIQFKKEEKEPVKYKKL